MPEKVYLKQIKNMQKKVLSQQVLALYDSGSSPTKLNENGNLKQLHD